MTGWKSRTKPGSRQLLANVDTPLQIPPAIAEDLSRTLYYGYRVLELWERVRRRFPFGTEGLLRFFRFVRERIIAPILYHGGPQ